MTHGLGVKGQNAPNDLYMTFDPKLGQKNHWPELDMAWVIV